MKKKKEFYRFLILSILICLIYIMLAPHENIPTCTKKVKYTLVKGDSLWNVGTIYCGDEDIREWIDRVMQFNKIEDAGEIPDGKIITVFDWR